MTASSKLHDDVGTASLRQALRADFVSNCIAPLQGADAGLRVSSARLVAVKWGERGVISYDTVAPDGKGPTLIGKVFADHDRASRLYDLLETLCRSSFSGDDLKVPRPLAHVAELGLVLYEAAQGRPLDRLEGTERTDGVLAAARWLATMHASAVDLDRKLDLRVETQNLSRWTDLVARERPNAGRAAASLLERFASMAEDIGALANVPIHKDFHYQHTLVDGRVVTVIDLDEARAGDPAFDVAHFVAYLRLLALRERMAPDELARLELAFLDAYGSLRPYEIDERHELFHIYSCLKIAKQLVTGRGPTPVPSGTECDRQVDLILREGLRCPHK